MAKLPSKGPVFTQNACVYAGLNTEISTENGMVIEKCVNLAKLWHLYLGDQKIVRIFGP